MKTQKITSTLIVLAIASLACNLQAAGSTATATADQSLLTQTATSTPSLTPSAEASASALPSTATATLTLVPSPTNTAPPPLPNWTVFKLGDQGHEVTALQYLLNFKGQNLVVDGNFGPKTRDAVKDFQTSKGLTVDGIVGAETWTALIQGAQVQQGSHGDAVKAAQSLLRGRFNYAIAVDGDFGPQTDSAVRDLQGSHYVAVDGIVGSDTWQVLIGKYPS